LRNNSAIPQADSEEKKIGRERTPVLFPRPRGGEGGIDRLHRKRKSQNSGGEQRGLTNNEGFEKRKSWGLSKAEKKGRPFLGSLSNFKGGRRKKRNGKTLRERTERRVRKGSKKNWKCVSQNWP